MTSVHNLAPPGPIIPSFWASFDLLQSTCLVLARIANTGWRWEWFTERSMRQYELRRHMLRKGCSKQKNLCHSCSQRPGSFWSAPGIATSGKIVHRKSSIRGLLITLRMLRIKSGKSDELRIRNDYSAHVQKIGPSRERSRFLVLTKRSAVPGNEDDLYRNKCYNHLLLPICYPLNTFGIFSAISIFRTFLQGEMVSVTSGLPQDLYISSFFSSLYLQGS